MMTGIPIENNLWTAYLLTIFFVVVGFAVYDVLYRRVPDRALVFFIPLAALAPVLQGYFLLNHGLPPLFLWPVATHALVGALLGFCIPLTAALATNGTGLGGGDIKFCGILGLVYKSALFKSQQHSKNKRELPFSNERTATHCQLLQPA